MALRLSLLICYCWWWQLGIDNLFVHKPPPAPPESCYPWTRLMLCTRYLLQKERLAEQPKVKQFDFNESQIFGKFDLFCKRVMKLVDLFTTIHQVGPCTFLCTPLHSMPAHMGMSACIEYMYTCLHTCLDTCLPHICTYGYPYVSMS